MDCLRVAAQAPTASNLQRWRWMFVTDPAKRAGLADLYRQGNEEYLSTIVDTGHRESERFYESAAYLTEHMHEVPVLMLPCIVGRAEGRSAESVTAMFASIMPATWSFMLALRSRGLGSVWTTLHLIKEREAAELLGIPDDVTQVGLLPVAYTLGTDFRLADRQPVEELTYWDTWEHR
jgi:nitroreductase